MRETMVNQPGAGLHICFADEKGDRVAFAVLHGDRCARCGARFAIERAGGATTKAEVLALIAGKAASDSWKIGSHLEADIGVDGTAKLELDGTPVLKRVEDFVTVAKLRSWLK